MKKEEKMTKKESSVKKEISSNSHNNDFGLASVVLGIMSIAFALQGALLSFGAIALGIVSFIFSMKQKKHHHNKWARSGMVLSIIGVILGITLLVIVIIISTNGAGVQ